MSNLLVPPLSSLRVYPPPVASQEKTSLVPFDDSSPISSSKSNICPTISESTLRSTTFVPPPTHGSSIGVRRAYSFSSSYTKDLTFRTILKYPSILARFIAYMDWFDLYHLLLTCQQIRNLFQDTGLRDVILTRYVAGYGYCLRTRDLNYFQDVQVSIHDLDLLCTSAETARVTTSNFKLICSDIPTLWTTPVSHARPTLININLSDF